MNKHELQIGSAAMLNVNCWETRVTVTRPAAQHHISQS